jgi:hypothetical protein
LGSLNIQNIRGNTIFVQSVMKETEILFIQVHWLFKFGRRRWYSGGPVSSFASISTVVEARPYPKKGFRDGLSASV